jgi:hypothetical protein
MKLRTKTLARMAKPKKAGPRRPRQCYACLQVTAEVERVKNVAFAEVFWRCTDRAACESRQLPLFSIHGGDDQ